MGKWYNRAMRIAIYDGQRENLIDEERIVNMWRADRKADADIECFDSRRDLYERHSRRPFDVMLIDTGSRREGMELAKSIRYYDKAVKIAFMSRTSEFAVESYKVHASQYFLKPVSQVEVKAFLDELLGEYNIKARGIMIKAEGRNQIIPLKSIVFFEALGKYVRIKLDNGEEKTVLRSLKSIEDELVPQDYFFKSYRSYIVSLKHVMQFTSQEIKMVSGERLPISRGKGKEFREKYLAYISR